MLVRSLGTEAAPTAHVKACFAGTDVRTERDLHVQPPDDSSPRLELWLFLGLVRVARHDLDGVGLGRQRRDDV